MVNDFASTEKDGAKGIVAGQEVSVPTPRAGLCSLSILTPCFQHLVLPTSERSSCWLHRSTAVVVCPSWGTWQSEG